MKIIFLGAPGAGKGTQAEKIAEICSIPTISTGAIIREAIKNGTEMGTAAKAFTEKGALVPDEVVIGIIKERLASQIQFIFCTTAIYKLNAILQIVKDKENCYIS